MLWALSAIIIGLRQLKISIGPLFDSRYNSRSPRLAREGAITIGPKYSDRIYYYWLTDTITDP